MGLGMGSRIAAGARQWDRLAAAGCALAVMASVSVPATAIAANATTVVGQVRVNQLGYPSSAPKRAYLLAPVAEVGAHFSVRNGAGTIVFSAPVGTDQGAWSPAYPHVYVLDFNSVSHAGAYRIAVSGPAAASSLSFRIDSAAALYSRAVGNALSYYQNSRDGSHFIRTALRKTTGHLTDSSAMTYLPPVTDSNGGFAGDLQALGLRIDASGAWWDAGDYLKFVETTSYTVAMMLIGVRDFPQQMGAGSTADFTAEAAFGLDWLSRMWRDDSRTLYYQVGIGTGNDTTVADHDVWRMPEVDDTYGGTNPLFRYIRNRPVFRAGPAGSKISPNLAGRLTADFALCAQVFSSSRPQLAHRCLLSAEHIFDLADTAPVGRLMTATPFDAYPETEWFSDMELGATELAIALGHGDVGNDVPHQNPDHYLRLAAHWAHAYITGPADAADTLNLYDVSAQAHFDLYRALPQADDLSALEVSRGALVADIGKQLTNAEAQAVADPFGFGFPWAAFDTTSHGAGLAVTAAEYDSLTGSHRYQADGIRWLGNILGANAWGTSLIVGDGTVFPNCMQHQVANIDGSTNRSAPILAGAAVEGPNTFAATGVVDGMVTCPPDGSDRFAQFNSSGAVYQDNVQSWSTVEPAIDLTATSPLAFAWQIAGHPSSP
jgi:endoglucanase